MVLRLILLLEFDDLILQECGHASEGTHDDQDVRDEVPAEYPHGCTLTHALC